MPSELLAQPSPSGTTGCQGLNEKRPTIALALPGACLEQQATCLLF